MLKKMCKVCGAEVPAVAKFCRECGTVVPTETSSVPAPGSLQQAASVPNAGLDIGSPQTAVQGSSGSFSAASIPSSNPPESPTAVPQAAQPVHQVVQQMPFGTVTVSVTAPPPPPVYIPPPPADPLPSATQSNIDSKEEQRIQESSAQAQVKASKNQSRLPGYVTGVIALAVLGGAGYWYSSGSGESIKATSSTGVPPEAQSTAVSPTLRARKDALNELISAAFDGKWQEVVSRAALIKSLVKTAGGNRSESEKLVQDAFKEETQDRSRAEQLVRKAIELDPSFVLPRFVLSNLLVDAKNLKEASDVLADALILDPTSSYGWVIAADIFAQTNRDALTAMRLALFFQAAEGDSNYWENRQEAFGWIKDVDSAQSVSDDLKSIVRTNKKLLLSTPAHKP